jgi:hypothetical protein
VMTGPGELDPLIRELISLAVSVTNVRALSIRSSPGRLRSAEATSDPAGVGDGVAPSAGKGSWDCSA